MRPPLLVLWPARCALLVLTALCVAQPGFAQESESSAEVEDEEPFAEPPEEAPGDEESSENLESEDSAAKLEELESSGSAGSTPSVGDEEEVLEDPNAALLAAESEAEDEELDIVEVSAERRPPSPISFRLSTEEVRTLPGAFGDAFRAIGTLPGLTPIISGFPYFYVRGAPPGNVGYRYDGVDVPTLFHVAIGPSVLQPAFVDSVELQPGAYPARFGQFSGGFVTADATPPAFELRGEAQIRIFDAGAFVEAPIASGKGSIALGGRYSYTAGILSLVVDDAVLDYRDFQARFTYDLTPHDRLTVFAMGSYDLFGSDPNGILEVNYGSEFYRLTAIHQRDFADGLWRTQVTGGYDRAVFGFDNATRSGSFSARSRYEQELHADFRLRAGLEANLRSNETVESEYLDPDLVGSDAFETTFPSRTDFAAGAWLDSVWDITQELRVVPGARVDFYESQGTRKLAFEPRLNVDYSLTADTGLLAAVGFAHQPPSFAIPIGGTTPAGLVNGLQRTLSTSVGAKTRPWVGAQASAAIFYNRFYNMTDAFGASDTGGGPDTDLSARSDGEATGLELNFTGRITDSLTGLLSYTLSRSTREIVDVEVFSQFDRTHVLNSSLSYDFGGGYRLGARYLAYSGIPFATDDGNPPVDSSPDRARFFQRLDARFEKRWELRGSGWMSLVVEGLNITGSSEETAPGVDGLAIVIPSIGVNGGF